MAPEYEITSFLQPRGFHGSGVSNPARWTMHERLTVGTYGARWGNIPEARDLHGVYFHHIPDKSAQSIIRHNSEGPTQQSQSLLMNR